MRAPEAAAKRVVVTGLGMVTPLGDDVPTSWEGIRSGRAGIDREVLPYVGVLPVARVSAKSRADGKERGDFFVRLALQAAGQAVEDASLPWGHIDPARVGVVVSSSKGGMETLWEACQARFLNRELHSDFCHQTFFPERASVAVRDRFSLRGPVSNVISACATGLQSIIVGSEWIRRGQCDVVMAGSSEASITPIVVAGFRRLGVLSTKVDPCPFDGRRDGFVMGEGGAVFVLESYDHARARHAAMWGEIVGFAMTADTHHPVQFDVSGESIVRATRLALRMAACAPEEVSYVNAHGTGTVQNDPIETRALKTIFGEYAAQLPVSSLKGSLGHLLGAAGSVELGLSLCALRDGWIPPTRFFAQRDPACDLDYVPQVGRSVPAMDRFLKLSFGFGGHTAALIVQKV